MEHDALEWAARRPPCRSRDSGTSTCSLGWRTREAASPTSCRRAKRTYTVRAETRRPTNRVRRCSGKAIGAEDRADHRARLRPHPRMPRATRPRDIRSRPSGGPAAALERASTGSTAHRARAPPSRKPRVPVDNPRTASGVAVAAPRTLTDNDTHDAPVGKCLGALDTPVDTPKRCWGAYGVGATGRGVDGPAAQRPDAGLAQATRARRSGWLRPGPTPAGREPKSCRPWGPARRRRAACGTSPSSPARSRPQRPAGCRSPRT